MKKLATVAEAHGLTIAPHSGSLCPVAEFAAVHLLAAIPSALMLERLEPDWEYRTRAIRHALVAGDGSIKVLSGPGLGVQIDENFVASHPGTGNTALATGGSNVGSDAETPYQQARRGRADWLSP